jgi:hypothetical protein
MPWPWGSTRSTRRSCCARTCPWRRTCFSARRT